MSKRTEKAGMGPGSLVYVGEKRTTPVTIRIMDYSQADVREITQAHLSQCDPFVQSDTVTWIDVDGIHDASVVEQIGQKFDIHVLVLEDIMNSQSRPKVEFFDNYIFITLKMIEFGDEENGINIEQLSIIAGTNYLITFQERPGDGFDPVRERIRAAKGRVRSKNGQYLAYLLLDTVVDNYILISEKFADQIDDLEAQVLQRANESTLHHILNVRKELLSFKKSIDPLKEAVNTMQKEVDEGISKYYRDLHDHLVYEAENLAMYREMIVNLLDLYHSSLSTKMNNVMKVLTIITTIFVPLTFVVGVYGMNFDQMPELHWHYGYFGVIAAMIALVIFQLFYFRRKGWL